MRMRGRGFEVDRTEAKLFGVCAGLARRTGVDATVIRIATVLGALIISFKLVAILYLAAAIVGSVGARKARREPAIGSDATSERMRNHELRMQAIETYVASSNSRLAREIEELR